MTIKNLEQAETNDRKEYRYIGYDMGDLHQALGLSASNTDTTFSSIIQAAIHTAALLEDAERNRLVLCRECAWWDEYTHLMHGECQAPGPKKEPWPGRPYHDTQVCAGDFGCVCGVRR